jgi:predicted DNA-binding protein
MHRIRATANEGRGPLDQISACEGRARPSQLRSCPHPGRPDERLTRLARQTDVPRAFTRKAIERLVDDTEDYMSGWPRPRPRAGHSTKSAGSSVWTIRYTTRPRDLRVSILSGAAYSRFHGQARRPVARSARRERLWQARDLLRFRPAIIVPSARSRTNGDGDCHRHWPSARDLPLGSGALATGFCTPLVTV